MSGSHDDALGRRLSFSVAETGAMLGLSRPTIYRLIQRGELQTFKVGARTLIHKAVLCDFIERHRTGVGH